MMGGRRSLALSNGDVAGLGLQIGPGHNASHQARFGLKDETLDVVTDLIKLREGQPEEDKMSSSGHRRHSSFHKAPGQVFLRDTSVTFDGVPPVVDAIKVTQTTEFFGTRASVYELTHLQPYVHICCHPQA